jgi:UDP-glucose 4-epimerase
MRGYLMSNWLITGAAGFIGSNIVEELVSRGETVVGIDDLSTGRAENLHNLNDKDNFTFIAGSITDKELLKEIMADTDYVLHLAAIPSVPRSISDPEKTHEANCLGTLRVLEAASDINQEKGNEQVKKVVFAASSSAYGNRSNHLPAKSEDLPVDPISPYAAQKVYGEHLCRSFSESFPIKTVSVRYFNVFGPNQDPDSEYSAVIPIFVKAILHDNQPTIFGDGLTSRDFTYVANNVDATIKAALSDKVGKGEIINVALGDSINLNELVDMINKVLGKEIRPKYSEERPGDVKHSKADIKKAKELIGYEPIVHFEEGLKKTIDYYKKIFGDC